MDAVIMKCINGMEDTKIIIGINNFKFYMEWCGCVESLPIRPLLTRIETNHWYNTWLPKIQDAGATWKEIVIIEKTVENQNDERLVVKTSKGSFKTTEMTLEHRQVQVKITNECWRTLKKNRWNLLKNYKSSQQKSTTFTAKSH